MRAAEQTIDNFTAVPAVHLHREAVMALGTYDQIEDCFFHTDSLG